MLAGNATVPMKQRWIPPDHCRFVTFALKPWRKCVAMFSCVTLYPLGIPLRLPPAFVPCVNTNASQSKKHFNHQNVSFRHWRLWQCATEIWHRAVTSIFAPGTSMTRPAFASVRYRNVSRITNVCFLHPSTGSDLLQFVTEHAYRINALEFALLTGRYLELTQKGDLRPFGATKPLNRMCSNLARLIVFAWQT